MSHHCRINSYFTTRQPALAKFYTYLHFRADDPDKGPFYVGKGQASRAWSRSSRSKHWISIVKKHGLHVQICGEFESEADAYQNERDLIAYWRNNDAILINLTDGGEGLQNPSDEVRNKISEAAHRQWQDATRRDTLLKARRTDDARRAQSEGIRRAKANPEARERHKAACIAGKNTKEAIAKRRDLSESQEYRKKLGDGVKAAHQRPEVRANKSAASSRRWIDPSYKENFAAKMQEMVERRWVEQGVPEEERARRRRKAENRRRLLAGGAPMTKAEASAMGHAARKRASEQV